MLWPSLCSWFTLFARTGLLCVREPSSSLDSDLPSAFHLFYSLNLPAILICLSRYNLLVNVLFKCFCLLLFLIVPWNFWVTSYSVPLKDTQPLPLLTCICLCKYLFYSLDYDLLMGKNCNLFILLPLWLIFIIVMPSKHLELNSKV